MNSEQLNAIKIFKLNVEDLIHELTDELDKLGQSKLPLLNISNLNDHYFTVEQPIQIDKLKGCAIHNSYNQMIAYVADRTGQELSDVNGMHFFIEGDKCIDRIGNKSIILSNIEDYISDYRE